MLAPPTVVEPWAAWPRMELGDNGELRFTSASRIRLPDRPAMPASDPRVGYRIQLEEGSVCAEVKPRRLDTEGPFTVVTSQLEVTVVGTHFCVEAERGLSEVSVQHGKVRVQRVRPGNRSQSVLLSAGETIRSDSQRLSAVTAHSESAHRRLAPGIAPIPSEPGASPVASPVASPLASTADELDAENTLYRGAVHARHGNHHGEAVDLLKSYQRRYPAGLYAPEVAAMLASELAAQ